MRRKRLWTFGARPHTVSVFEETLRDVRLVRAQWKLEGRRVTKSWPASGATRKEAKAFAEELANELMAPAKAADLTLRQLWESYTAAEFDALRPKTLVNYRAHWRSWETFADRETKANAVTRETLDGGRRELRARGTATSQLRKHIELVRRVYRFGVERGLVAPTSLTDYRVRVAKEDRTQQGAEYSSAEALKIIGALNPKASTQWRAWAFCIVAHYMGTRANAIRHLTWDDVSEDGTIIWRARWDKLGRERTQPAPRQVIDALWVAWGWRLNDDYVGRWVFYTPRQEWKGDQPITYGGLNWMLHQAEQRAKVVRAPGNAAHRFRRGAFGNVIDLTGGDVNKAMQWIGDTDPKVASRYLKKRDERDREVADLLSKEPE